jgi:hypothetical protein
MCVWVVRKPFGAPFYLNFLGVESSFDFVTSWRLRRLEKKNISLT